MQPLSLYQYYMALPLHNNSPDDVVICSLLAGHLLVRLQVAISWNDPALVQLQ